MKVQLLIEGSPAALAAILANLPALEGTSVTAMPTPAPLPGGDDDDESGDTPTAAAPGQIDGRGFPHDKRIHSETPTLTSKGVWRNRRGVSKEDIAAVEAELRANAAQPVPQPMPMPVAAQPVPSMPPVTDPSGQAIPAAQPMPMPVAAQPVPQPMPVVQQPPVATAQPMPMPVAAQPVPTPAAPPSPVVAAAPTDFATFMTHIGEKMNLIGTDGKPLITADYLQAITNEIATAFNNPLSVITDIGANPQMIQYASQLMMRDGRW